MIANCDILRIDRPTGANAAGEMIRETGVAIEGLRGFVSAIKNSHRMTLGAVIKDCTRLLAVRKAELAAFTQEVPVLGMHVVLQVDGGEDHTGVVEWIEEHVLGGNDGALTRWNLFLRIV